MLAFSVNHLHKNLKMAANFILTPKKSKQMRSSIRLMWTIRSSCAIQNKFRTTKIFLATKSNGDNRSKVSSRALIPLDLRRNYVMIKCCCGILSSYRTDYYQQLGGTICTREQGCRIDVQSRIDCRKSAFSLRSCRQAISVRMNLANIM